MRLTVVEKPAKRWLREKRVEIYCGAFDSVNKEFYGIEACPVLSSVVAFSPLSGRATVFAGTRSNACRST